MKRFFISIISIILFSFSGLSQKNLSIECGAECGIVITGQKPNSIEYFDGYSFLDESGNITLYNSNGSQSFQWTNLRISNYAEIVELLAGCTFCSGGASVGDPIPNQVNVCDTCSVSLLEELIDSVSAMDIAFPDSFKVEGIDNILLCLDSVKLLNAELIEAINDGIEVTITNDPLEVNVDFTELIEFLDGKFENFEVTATIDNWEDLFEWLLENELNVSFDELTEWLAGNSLDVNVDFSDLFEWYAENCLNVNVKNIDQVADAIAEAMAEQDLQVTITNGPLEVEVDFTELIDFFSDEFDDFNVTATIENWEDLFEWLNENDLNVDFSALTDWLDENSLDVNVDFSDLFEWYAENELNVDGIDEILDKLCDIDSTLQVAQTDSILEVWCAADSLLAEELLENDSLLLSCLDSLKTLLNDTLQVAITEPIEVIFPDSTGSHITVSGNTQDTVLHSLIDSLLGDIDYDTELVFYCGEDGTAVGENNYEDGVFVSTTIPKGTNLGVCEIIDTIDYEKYSTFICVNGETIERIRCYENDLLVGTLYEPAIESPLEFELGSCKVECNIATVRIYCFVNEGESQSIKTNVQSSDCDSGAADLAGRNCGRITITLDATIASIGDMSADDGTVDLTIGVINGSTAEVDYCWTQVGNITPSGGYTIPLMTDKGLIEVVATASSPYAICNNDDESFIATSTISGSEFEIKEICYDGCPNVFQDSQGNEIDTSGLIACIPLDTLPEIRMVTISGADTLFKQDHLKWVCVIDEDSAVNGINGERWDNSDGDDTDNLGATDWLPNSDVFANGIHVNGTPTESVTITNNWSLNDNDFSNIVLPDIHSQERYTAYLNITQPMLLRDNNGNWGEYLTVFIQDCNKDMVEVHNSYTRPKVSTSAGQFFEACEGFRKIEIQINDYSWYGGFNLQYSTDDGVTWVAFPISETYTSQPRVNEVCTIIDEDGNQFNLDGTPFIGKVVKCDPACYPMSREELPDTEVSIVNGCFDVDGDPANYINVTQEVIFTSGEQESVTFYQSYGDPDNQTEIPVGDNVFVDCATGAPIDEPIVPVDCEYAYVVDAFAPSGDQGVNFEYWNDLNQTYTAQDQAADIFDGDVDYSGMPAINSNEGAPVYRKEADLFIRDPDITQNAYRFWTYLYITEPIRLREFHPTAESFVYYSGECQTESTLAATGLYRNNQTAAYDVSLPAGIHYLGGEVYDFSAWGYTRYQYSADNGVTWKNIPASWLYCKEPVLSECQVQVCTKPSGIKVLTEIETCLPLGSEYTLKKPSLCSGTLAVASEPQCAPQTFYNVSGEIGTTEQQWTVNVGPASTAAGSSYKEAFSGTDSEGYPEHVNPTPDAVISSTITSTTNVAGAILDDQAQSDFWIYLEDDTDLRESNGTAEAAGIWISGCGNSTMTEVVDAPYTNTGSNLMGTYPAGIYRVRLYHSDATSNGVSRLQGLTNGTWSNLIPFINKPIVTVVKGWYCSDGNNYNQDRSEALGEAWTCNNPNSCPSSSGGCSSIKITE